MTPYVWLVIALVATAAGTWVHLALILPRLRALAAEPGAGAAVAGPLAATWLPVAITLPAILAFSGLGTGAAATSAAARGLSDGAMVIDAAPWSAALAGLAPVHGALAGLGVALLAGVLPNASGRVPAVPPADVRPGLRLTAAALVGAMVLLLVVSLERHLPMMLGQLAFAMLAVLLWMVGPAASHGESPGGRDRESAAGGALLLACGIAVMQGVAARAAIAGSDGIVGRVAVGAVFVQVAMLVAASGTLPGGLGRRAPAWCGVVGVLGGIGTVTLLRLPGAVRDAMADLSPSPVVAGGFGILGPEAILLGLVTTAVLLPDRGWVPRFGGVACLAFAIVFMAERLLG